MSYIVPGFEYDIFISYRQKDNKHDSWVTEFVNHLQGELESTFKEDISVYFDINPHDGLLETHDVDASLKDKLKCLVFIPIISRTYCDPKSFAWEHEFKAFVEQASKDRFGLKIRLPSGNVASRVLPIRIHDLDPEDKTLFERELGGVLRSIEFIYREPGVKRPLTPFDDEKKNLNNTRYRNQINKVAIAIEELIHSLKKAQLTPLEEKQQETLVKDNKDFEIPRLIGTAPNSQKLNKWLIISLILILCISGAFAVYKIIHGGNKADNLVKLEKSIAVLPFVNDSPEKDNEYFCNGMMEEILTQLQKISALKVKSRTSVEKYRNPEKDIKDIGRELGVSLIIEGSVRKVGNDLRINVQLIDTKTGDHLWAETYKGKYTTEIFEFQSNLAKKVAASMNTVIKPKEEKRIDNKPTTEILAHDLSLKGWEMINKWHYDNDSFNLRLALNLFNKALEIDPEYFEANDGKAATYVEAGNYDSALFYYKKCDEIDPENYNSTAGKGVIYFYSNKFDSALKYAKKALDIAPDEPWNNILMAQVLLSHNNEVIKALSYWQKACDLGGNSDPEIISGIGKLYYLIGDYQKAYKNFIYELSFHSQCNLIGYCNHILLAQTKYNEAFHFLDSVCSVYPCEQQCNISRFYIYIIQKKFENAEKYYNNAVNAGYKRSENDDIYIAYLYKETGRKNKALSILNNSVKRDENLLKEKMDGDLAIIKLRIAAAYAILDENKKALRYLSEFKTSSHLEFPITIRTFPGFDKLRGDSEFQAIVKTIEDEKTAIRAQVRKMEERGEISL